MFIKLTKEDVVLKNFVDYTKKFDIIDMLPRKVLQQGLNLTWRQNRSSISSFNGNRGQKHEGKYEDDNQVAENLRLPPCQMPNMMDIGSRTIFDEDHDIFRSSVRRYMRDELAPNHKHYEEQGRKFFMF